MSGRDSWLNGENWWDMQVREFRQTVQYRENASLPETNSNRNHYTPHSSNRHNLSSEKVQIDDDNRESENEIRPSRFPTFSFPSPARRDVSARRAAPRHPYDLPRPPRARCAAHHQCDLPASVRHPCAPRRAAPSVRSPRAPRRAAPCVRRPRAPRLCVSQ